MKRVEAIIVPTKVDEVREALSDVGVTGMTVSEQRIVGRGTGRYEVWKGTAFRVDFSTRVRMIVVVQDALVRSVLDALEASAAIDKLCGGTVLVSDLVEAVRIRTGERGEAAI
jgi:nitrogen regulatory protein P-II 1